ncbi:MAG: thiamine pyrophosphate-binding protein [Alphaproteobacteria bacterium]|nr:thiamine pyrophosphate-binding protein [Alphaproteobacteria bacterium]
MTVSDLLLKVLHSFGVRHVFGIPGDAINDVTDALRRQDKIDFVQVRHEEAGAFAASAQAKLTGRLAACLGTAGPGGVHLLNGLYDAKMDHTPVIAITGQVATSELGTSQHQEVNLERLFTDVAVYSRTVTTAEQLPNVFVEACSAAIAHRGVAHVSIPTDVSGNRLSGDGPFTWAQPAEGEITPAAEDLHKAVTLIDNAEKIVILAGIGCAEARVEMLALAQRIGAPIVRSLRAKEVIDDDHPMCVGGLGMLGGPPASKAMEDCDLLIMAGTDFPYQDFYPAGTDAIQIDSVPTQIGKRYPVTVGLAGHAGPVLSALAEAVEEKPKRDFLKRMQTQMEDWREDQASAETSNATPIHPARIMRELSGAAPDDAVFVCDTGTVNAWTARHLHIKRGQRFTLSGGLASMAFALPGAIGAQLAYPERAVFALCGDGGFSMLMADFVTAVRNRLPITVIILNNRKLAFISLEQKAKGLPDHATDLLNPDFAAFAEACGGLGLRVDRPEGIREALDIAAVSEKPAIIDIAVDPEALIVPPRISAREAMNFGLAKIREKLAN